jgi:excisionase family DNA binding protein
MSRLSVIYPLPADRADLRALTMALAGNPRLTLAIDGEGAAELPSEVVAGLRDVIRHLARGIPIEVVPLDEELSTSEAAGILGVSRQYFTRLVDRGDVPSTFVGTHRRVTLEAVLEYKERNKHRRAAILNELSTQSVELGAYATSEQDANESNNP